MQVNSRDFENYKKGGVIEKYQYGNNFLSVGADQSGANLKYDHLSDDKSKLLRTSASYNGKDFLASIGLTNRSPLGWESTGSVNYSPQQGVTGRLEQGYNMQIGRTNLRPGQGRMNITPYVGAQLDPKYFANNEKEVGFSTKDLQGNDRGPLDLGLRVGGSYQLTKNLSAFGNAGVQLPMGAPRFSTREERQEGAGDIVGSVLGKPEFTGNAGLRLRFKSGGTLLYKK
jgi:hypothetical protein